ncbi:MAG: M28 family peptidase [Acidimicrobiales bacterium]
MTICFNCWRPTAIAIAVILLASACSSSDNSSQPVATSDAPAATVAVSETTTAVVASTIAPETTPPPTTIVAESAVELSTEELVAALSSDELNGRNNDTAESVAARDLLIGQLELFTSPAFPDQSGSARYTQSFASGTNLLALIPGGELADELVIVGAHYDHLGPGECNDLGLDDSICNGATDNATGVAAAMSVARSIASADKPPRRSVLIAFWDREEDGLLGAAHYVTDPSIPLENTVAYVNFDIQGANLLPGLGNATLLIGAETGGENLIESTVEATKASSLDTFSFSLLFGQGRSDHAVLVSAGVPSVFFSDANSGCYHTVRDDLEIVDFDKLDQQIATALALSVDLANNDSPPAIDSDAPIATFGDAEQLLEVVRLGEADFGLFDRDTEAASRAFLSELQTIVDAGNEAFDGAATGSLLSGASAFVSALSELECDGYLEG